MELKKLQKVKKTELCRFICKLSCCKFFYFLKAAWEVTCKLNFHRMYTQLLLRLPASFTYHHRSKQNDRGDSRETDRRSSSSMPTPCNARQWIDVMDNGLSGQGTCSIHRAALISARATRSTGTPFQTAGNFQFKESFSLYNFLHLESYLQHMYV